MPDRVRRNKNSRQADLPENVGAFAIQGIDGRSETISEEPDDIHDDLTPIHPAEAPPARQHYDDEEVSLPILIAQAVDEAAEAAREERLRRQEEELARERERITVLERERIQERQERIRELERINELEQQRLREREEHGPQVEVSSPQVQSVVVGVVDDHEQEAQEANDEFLCKFRRRTAIAILGLLTITLIAVALGVTQSEGGMGPSATSQLTTPPAIVPSVSPSAASMHGSTTSHPTRQPTKRPTQTPTLVPSVLPSDSQTEVQPIRSPTSQPTGRQPTQKQTGSPIDTSGLWTHLGQTLNGEAIGDYFGYSVALSADGSIVAAGTHQVAQNGLNSGYVRILWYNSGTNQWQQLGQDLNGEAAGDQFGTSVALSVDGSIVAAGASFNDGNGLSSGHVRIFRYNSGANQWQQMGQDLNGEAALDEFGDSVAVSADGSIVAVGARRNDGNSGRVRIFRYISGTNQWQQLGQALNGEAANDWFGDSVALSADGSIVAAGATLNDGNGTDSGHVRILRYNSGTNQWQQLGQDLNGDAANDNFGHSVALSADGSIVAAGTPRRGLILGLVRIFRYNSGTNQWQQLGQDLNGEAVNHGFGQSVALSADGSIVAAGALRNARKNIALGHIRILRYNSGTNQWQQLGQDLNGEAGGDRFGWSVALSADGSIVAAGATWNDGNGFESGHVRLHVYTDQLLAEP